MVAGKWDEDEENSAHRSGRWGLTLAAHLRRD
ncbi:uncharacterized protein G2W53_043873 [Senna tora]|uniref:Uncharacterized protein n=1 Tax=Senna tora TaxID=362788 RepID=A0A834SJG8_9FABA|nr:uncharacterized protein G2W53_043873 [Senna tora]